MLFNNNNNKYNNNNTPKMNNWGRNKNFLPNHGQFWYVLYYRFTIPLFTEVSLCPSCNTLKMDK